MVCYPQIFSRFTWIAIVIASYEQSEIYIGAYVQSLCIMVENPLKFSFRYFTRA